MKATTMILRRLAAPLLLAALAHGGSAYADCVDGTTVEAVRAAHARGEAAEAAGRREQAARAYAEAQHYVCGASNPVAADAARRAAPLALELGRAAEAAGRPFGTDAAPGAYDWYELGGHFSDADRVLIAALDADPLDGSRYEQARRHFDARALESFHANQRVRIAATGGYRLDPAQRAYVRALPADNVSRLLAREADLFSADFLSERARLQAGQPTHPNDLVATMQAGQAQMDFAQRWPEDPLDGALDALDDARGWAVRGDYDRGEPDALLARLHARAGERMRTLERDHAAVPELLGRALDYARRASADPDADVQRLQGLAERLGDAAMQAERYRIAQDYFQLTEAYDKASAAQAAWGALARDTGEAMTAHAAAQAAAIQGAFADPETVAALQRQAEAMLREVEKSQAAQQAFEAEQQSLEDELGL